MSKLIIIVVAIAALAGGLYYFYVLPDQGGQSQQASTGQVALPECMSEDRPVPRGSSRLACCSGLKEINCSTPDATAKCVPCSARIFCTACGDGRCKGRENFCSCPEDCPKPAKGASGLQFGSPKEDIMKVYGLTETKLQSELLQLLAEKNPALLQRWRSENADPSKADLFEWLYKNDMSALLDLLSGLEKPETGAGGETGGGASTGRSQVIDVSSKKTAIEVLEGKTGQDLREDMTTMVDIGNGVWQVCSTYGQPGNTLRICCEIPKTYNTADILDCSTTIV